MADFLIEDHLTGHGSQLPADPCTKLNQSIIYLQPGCTEELALIRLLLGKVAITCCASGQKIDQNHNFSVLGHPLSRFATRLELEQYLTTRDLETSLLNSHLVKNFKQSGFHADLCGETIQFFVAHHNHHHTVAFLHAYRFLERLSFPLPLVYASRTRDFKSAYADLKIFFEGKDKGELGFFRKFLDSSIDSTLLDATTTIDFSTCGTDLSSRYFTVLKRFVDTDHVVSESTGSAITVKNRALISILIKLRNRYFHSLSGNPDNISTIEVPNADEFFRPLNLALMNWLAFMYFEVLQHNLDSMA